MAIRTVSALPNTDPGRSPTSGARFRLRGSPSSQVPEELSGVIQEIASDGHVLDLVPAHRLYLPVIEIEDRGARHGHQDRRVGRYDELRFLLLDHFLEHGDQGQLP